MELEKIAELACLTLTPEERKRLEKDMEEILAFANDLPDLAEEQDLTDAAVDVCLLRTDAPADCFPRETLLAAAHGRTEEYITVPRVLQESGGEDEALD